MRNKRIDLSRPLVTALLVAGTLTVGAMTMEATAMGAESSQAERISVGQEAPAFSLTSSDGKTYSLADLRGEKDLVLVFFRGTW